VTKSFNDTLKALHDIEVIIEDIKAKRNVMTNKIMIEDYNKILGQLEEASNNLINAVVLFQKYEGSL
jgi:hypothetical protein